MENKILTRYDKKPIPIRNYDWEAYRENYDEGSPIGYGVTEQKAINDLIEKENEAQS